MVPIDRKFYSLTNHWLERATSRTIWQFFSRLYTEPAPQGLKLFHENYAFHFIVLVKLETARIVGVA